MTTFNGGSLGSCIDEERSKLRYVMWIAEFSESSNFRTQMARQGSLCSMSVWVSEHPLLIPIVVCKAFFYIKKKLAYGIVCFGALWGVDFSLSGKDVPLNPNGTRNFYIHLSGLLIFFFNMNIFQKRKKRKRKRHNKREPHFFLPLCNVKEAKRYFVCFIFLSWNYPSISKS